MALTAKMEKFCVENTNGKNISDAYRAAYSTKNMKPASVNRKAFDLFSNGKITARISEIKKELADKNLWSREKSVDALRDIVEGTHIIDGNEVCSQDKDIISAVKELNSMHGFNEPKKIDHTSSDKSMTPQASLTREEIEAELIKAGFDPKKVALDE